jgi:hypothetical protein
MTLNPGMADARACPVRRSAGSAAPRDLTIWLLSINVPMGMFVLAGGLVKRLLESPLDQGGKVATPVLPLHATDGQVVDPAAGNQIAETDRPGPRAASNTEVAPHHAVAAPLAAQEVQAVHHGGNERSPGSERLIDSPEPRGACVANLESMASRVIQ